MLHCRVSADVSSLIRYCFPLAIVNGQATISMVFISDSPAGRLAGTKIALRSHICLRVCSSTIITCAKLCHCITIAMSTVEICRLSRPRYFKLAYICAASMVKKW